MERRNTLYGLRPRRIALALLSMTMTACALYVGPPKRQALPLERFAGQPGVEITKTGKGDSEKLELRKAGVRITQWRQDTEVQTLGVDESGHGAILCARAIYSELRLALDACHPKDYPEAREEFSNDIDSMDIFIAENSLPPTSKAEIEKSLDVDTTEARQALAKMTPANLQKHCRSDSMEGLISPFLKMPKTERRKFMADLLSVPRPPVMNPCF